jgi:flagellar assembly factor FliW
MPKCETRYFGTIAFDDPAVIAFPAGLPGFAQCRRFLPLEDASRKPLIFLQSLEEPHLCFLALPVAAVEPAYQLKISADDLALIGLDKQPGPDDPAECWAIIAVGEDHLPSANLLAPVVINRATGLAVQAVRSDSIYSCRHPLATVAEVSACS